MKLPEALRVMPLPNAILFPRVLLPLYIFEARYKKMLGDCLKGDRMFAVALLRKGCENEGAGALPYPIATVGFFFNDAGSPDVSSLSLLEGLPICCLSD